ncbi:MAG: IS66 family insertion sequence element accessory protein TnpB [Planctomycetaceae bacterium]
MRCFCFAIGYKIDLQDPAQRDHGLAIWYKRLEKGSFQFPTDLKTASDINNCQITSEELSLLLDGIDLSSVQRRPRFALPRKSS